MILTTPVFVCPHPEIRLLPAVMMSRVFYGLSSLLLVSLASGQRLTLTLSKDQPVIWRDSVDITCKYDGPKSSDTLALAVTKSGFKGSFVNLLLNPTPITAKIHPDFQSRVELISSQSDLQANKLAVRIKNVTCDDAANYTCKLLTTGAGIPHDVKSLTTNAAPESVKISNVGSNLPSVGERLELRCMGNIGNPAAEFEWYMRRGNEVYFTRINDNITVSDPTEVKCQYHRQSTLVLYPSVGDANIYIQCIARNSHGFVNDTSYFELGRIATTTRVYGKPGKVKEGGLGGGEIAGIVLGILAVIVLVVLLVWFLVIRPNNVPPENETPADEIPPSPKEKDYGNRENVIYATTMNKDKNQNRPILTEDNGLHYAELEMAIANRQSRHQQHFLPSRGDATEYADIKV